ncbi:D(5)-like dopamine receptor [Trichoplax sp. H2]|uniref:G-protein coupled receptors family 1 profile domain-containing protein n=1 Tax=Trichoplax adhaerens TaxID=10228 RepID=B3RWJ4_TRIAD|nr:hypothetical protein TRIADDRAFT_56770 [Trichoplax adhaerens]EDV25146.1 hypothetical protein TRIADDRAFT_56770 [Trichoplax adhaerens]RDD37996.1 D(5)-like dopamine receptor [Trichoplax sp. H2]|eukprot:XP_002113036.1 hypothetical protein TRIADDRAFT_56770 [Trichoplax adhaerens]
MEVTRSFLSITTSAITLPSRANGTLTSTPLAYLIIWPIIAVVTFIGNVIMLATIMRTKHLRNGCYVLMGSMFVSGILYSLLYLAPRWANPYWREVVFICSITQLIGILFIVNLNLHICAIAMIRFLGVKYPLRFKAVSSPTVAYISVPVIWIISILVGFMPLVTFMPYKIDTCVTFGRKDSDILYLVIVFAMLFFIPLIVISVFYATIWKILKVNDINMERHRQRASGSSYERSYHVRAAKQTIIIVMVFAAFWLPFVLTFLLFLFDVIKIDQTIIIQPTQFIAFSYAGANPFIHYIQSSGLRHGTKVLFRRFFYRK